MYPILYTASETSFTSQGLGTLSDAVSCTVYETLSGEFELEMTYPTSGVHYSDIANYKIIAVDLPYLSDRQPFRVYKIGKVLCGLTTIYARQVSYGLNYIFGVLPSIVSYSTAAAAVGYLADDQSTWTNHFRLTNELSASGTWSVDKLVSVKALMKSITDVFGGEWEYNAFNAVLKARRGADNGYKIRYGKNLLDFKMSSDTESDVSQVTVIWYGTTSVSAPYADRRFVTVSTGRSSTVPIRRDLVVDVSNDYQSDPGDSVLTALATEYIAAHGLNAAVGPSIDLDFVAIESDNIALGDTVHVELTDASLTMRAIEVRWDVLRERYDHIKLGTAETTLADTIVNMAVDMSDNKNREKVYQLFGQRTKTLSAATSTSVITSAEINLLLGVNDSSADNTMVIFCNADGATSEAHINGSTFQNNNWYAVLDRSFTGTIKVDFQILYRRKQDV